MFFVVDALPGGVVGLSVSEGNGPSSSGTSEEIVAAGSMVGAVVPSEARSSSVTYVLCVSAMCVCVCVCVCACV